MATTAITVAVAPASAYAAAPAVYQTAFSTCRARLAAPNSVLLIGDSLASGWMTSTADAFTAAGRPVCINAQSGRQTAEAIRQLARYKGGGLIKPQTTVVMAIGSNDTRGAREGYLRWQVDNVQRVLQYGKSYQQPVVWVDC